MLALSVSIPEHLDEAVRLVAEARSARPALIVIAGGRALAGLPDAGARIGADFVAGELRDLHRRLPELLRRPAPPPQPE